MKQSEELGLKSFKGVLWNVFGQLASQGMGFAMGIILARMIAPESYGLIAMGMVIIGLTGSLIDGGFGTALIRKIKPSDEDYHTVFWFNIAVALTLYGLLWWLAPAVERFYETKGLVPVIRWLSVSLVVRALVAIQSIQLTKKLAFKALNFIALIATFISGIVGVTMALKGYGVWALVAQQITSAALSSLLLFTHNRWFPAAVFSLTSFRELFSFGSKLLISGILNSVFQNLYPLLIGKFFSPAMLAYYTRADSYQKLLSQNLTSVVQRVSFPSLVPLQDDNTRLKNAYRQMIRMVMLVNAPVMIGLIAVAEPLISFMITDKWLPTVPFLQWLCLAGLLYPLHSINLNVINVKGRSDIFLKLEIAKKIMVVAAIFAGLPWGVMGLVVAQVITSFLAYFLNAWFSIRLVNYSIKEQLFDIIPTMLLASVMSLLLWILPEIVKTKYLWIQLVIQLLAGLIVYLTGCKIMRLQAYLQLIEMLQMVWKEKTTNKTT